MKRISHLLLTLSALASSPLQAQPDQCSYESYQWSTVEKRAVNRHTVTHPYSELSRNEIDPITGCSVCREDQVRLSIPPLKPFYVCHIVAPYIDSAVRDLLAAGEPIQTIIGYRVGKTRGDLDKDGLRTRFSNHSFGIAIDINSAHNGLYDHCLRFDSTCRLIRGGPWKPQTQPLSLARDGAIVERLKREGFHWGGEIRGRQKDFMHFSPSGY